MKKAISIEDVVIMLNEVKKVKNIGVDRLEEIATALGGISGPDPVITKAIGDIKIAISYLRPL